MPAVHRHLLWLAFVLACVVVAASVTLRLSANGIGCTPWPACYGQTETANAAQQTTLVQALRLTHRIAASGFALIALLAVLLGWKRWPRTARAVGVGLLLVTALLAGIGRYTPSPLPLITLINVLGGFSLLGLLAWLLVATRDAAPRGATPRFVAATCGLLLLLLAWQAASGALISARLAGDACAAAGCGQFWLPGATALFNPIGAGSAQQVLSVPGAGQPLHMLHRALGLGLVLIAWAVVKSWPRQQARALRLAGWTLTATLLTGVVAATWDGSLAATLAHALLAGLATAGLGVALATGNTGRVTV